MRILPDTSGKTVLAIPCEHPDAKDGVFYCVPSFYDSPHMWEDYKFVLVDTKKVMEELQKNNPELLRHAEYKFEDSKPTAETVKDWLEATSFEHPQNMGNWVYDGKHRPLAMSSGQAGLIKLVQELNIPCFPITVHKTDIDLVEQKFGYDGADLPRPDQKRKINGPQFKK